MPDWVLPLVICAAIIVLIVLSERRGTRETAGLGAAAEPAPKGDRAEKGGAEGDPQPSGPTSESIAITVDSKSAAVAKAPAPSQPELPKLAYEEDEDVDPTRVGAKVAPRSLTPPTKKIVYDEDAATEEPTKPGTLILLVATAQTDKGARRKRNEDNLLVMEDDGLYVVADGMGGYNGGEIASELAVRVIEKAFMERTFVGEPHESIPKRASELARAIQAANEAILDRASQDKLLEGMGTTVCAARFSANKQRLYVAHVGDSRLYRLRDGALRQMTSDHTMKDFGMTGPGSDHLSRAVGVWPTVPVDIVLAKPLPSDVYLLCSDGLSKMVDDETVKNILVNNEEPAAGVEQLVKSANDRGGKDNITCILIRVYDPKPS